MTDKAISTLPQVSSIEANDRILATRDPEGTPESVNIDAQAFVDATAEQVMEEVVVLVTSETSSATPTINTDGALLRRIHKITALATNITSMSTNLSGSPNEGDMLAVFITASGGTRTIAWGASFEDDIAALPVSVGAGETVRALLMWDGSDWVCMASGLVA